METQFLDYADGDTTCEAYVAHDISVSGRRPVVLVFHAWGGQDDFARSKAERLAKLGYLGVAIDMYGKGRRGSSPEENGRLMTPFVQDRSLLLRRASAGWNFARHHPLANEHAMGAIGFCFGGMCALDLARAGRPGLQGVVSFHGLLGAPVGVEPGARPMHARVLACHGWNDPMARPADFEAFAREMTLAGCDWNALVFGHRGHAFTNPVAADAKNGMQHCPRAERRAFAAMEDFLHECLRAPVHAPVGVCPIPA
jgi:dienelactone hydrolase